MRAAICDDDKDAIKDLETKVKRYITIKSINVFNNMELFWGSIEDGHKYSYTGLRRKKAFKCIDK